MKLNYSYNWNNKLDCKAYSSLRKSARFEIGDLVEVSLDKKFHHRAYVRYKKRIEKISQLNEAICLIDTGYSKKETIKVLKRMYKDIVNIEDTHIYFYVFEKRKE